MPASRPSHQLYARTFDAYNKHWSNNQQNNKMFLLIVQNYANDMLNARGHIFLNDIYDMLGFERTARGQLVGWFKREGSNPIDFGINEIGEDDLNGPAFTLSFNPDGIIYDKLSD